MIAYPMAKRGRARDESGGITFESYPQVPDNGFLKPALSIQWVLAARHQIKVDTLGCISIRRILESDAAQD